MTEMSPNLRKIYLFHFFNTIAISVVANFLFLDRIFLRMGLNMQQFGFIKGFAYLLPMGINLLVSPFIGKLNRDREIVGIGYLIRVFLPLSFFLIPGRINDRSAMAVAVMVILVTVHIFPIIANNSIQMLVRYHVRQEVLGTHLSLITVVWTLPGFLLAIPLSKILDMHTSGTDQEFYRTMFLIMLFTALFEIIATIIIMRLPRHNPEHHKNLRFRDIFQPFKNEGFRNLLRVIVVSGMISSMIGAFINPYLLNVQNMSMTLISVISAAVSLLSILALPFWGKLADHVGGKNIYGLAAAGLTVGILALLGKGSGFILVYAFLSWQGSQGLFGSAIYSSQQFMIFTQSEESKRSVFFAASTFVFGLGWFLGSFFGGFLLEWLRNIRFFSNPMTSYRIYFFICSAVSLSLVWLTRALVDDSEKRSARKMGIAMYRTARTLFGRIR